MKSKVSKNSLVLGLNIEGMEVNEEGKDKYYTEYHDFVGDLLNQFYDYVLEHPEQETIGFSLEIFNSDLS